jgi:hypothetical protein
VQNLRAEILHNEPQKNFFSGLFFLHWEQNNTKIMSVIFFKIVSKNWALKQNFCCSHFDYVRYIHTAKRMMGV